MAWKGGPISPKATHSMLLTLPDSDAIALEDPHGRLSFRELSVAVGECPFPTRERGILRLEAEASCQFVVMLLAAFRADVPVLVTPDGEGNLFDSLTTASLDPRCALVLGSGGSTGRPKLVQLSASAILENASHVRTTLQFDAAGSQYLFLPLHNAFGLLSQLLPGLLAGIRTVLVPRFAQLKGFIADGSLRGMVPGTPSQLTALLGLLEPLPRLRQAVTRVVSAGGPLSLPQRRALVRGFPQAVVSNNYGLTEFASRVSSIDSRDERFYAEGCVGRLLPGLEAETSERGHLLLRGRKRMLGYLGDPAPMPTGEWFDTLDFGHLDEEGFLYFFGRADQRIKIHGVFAERLALEEALRTKFGEDQLQLFPDGASVVVLLPTAGRERWLGKTNQIREHLEAQGLRVSLRQFDETALVNSGKITKELVDSALEIIVPPGS